MAQFSTLLVANRGEIAVRIIRTAKQLGLRTIAVYSDADCNALHVGMADDAVHIGPSPVGESYLRGDKIIEAAKSAGAEAIHPGYGFLSENADFAKAVSEAGLIFVGPPVHAIDVMGDKARSKRAMIEAGVPCVPGYQGEDQSDDRLIAESAAIGFPLMVKAAAGGGGRGMRLVTKSVQLPEALKLARSEAKNAFGSDELIIERAIDSPRHVEVQVFADSHGTTIHLGERDCSVQRRHQKIIEESPCPVMTPELRDRMGRAAISAAQAVEYQGAGTVEFLLDGNGDFYFLEMNTRLQVEHPVTEMVTGLDLVALQLKVAAGESLGIQQEDVSFSGHAVEVRLYAEDPENGFLPSTGPVALWKQPEGSGIRVDSGIESGGEVSPFYDPMVAKIIAHGETREQARLRLVEALQQTALFGPTTNRDFLIDALGRNTFGNGQATTSFITEEYGQTGYAQPALTHPELSVAALLEYLGDRTRSMAEAHPVNEELLNWANVGSLQSVCVYRSDDETIPITVIALGPQSYRVVANEGECSIVVLSFDQNEAELQIDGKRMKLVHHREANGLQHIADATRSFSVINVAGAGAAGAETGGGRVMAPMHGLLLEVCVEAGQSVARGDKLAVLEAMKMQHEILAEIGGQVSNLGPKAGTQLAAGDLILEIAAE